MLAISEKIFSAATSPSGMENASITGISAAGGGAAGAAIGAGVGLSRGLKGAAKLSKGGLHGEAAKSLLADVGRGAFHGAKHGGKASSPGAIPGSAFKAGEAVHALHNADEESLMGNTKSGAQGGGQGAQWNRRGGENTKSSNQDQSGEYTNESASSSHTSSGSRQNAEGASGSSSESQSRWGGHKEGEATGARTSSGAGEQHNQQKNGKTGNDKNNSQGRDKTEKRDNVQSDIKSTIVGPDGRPFQRDSI